MKKIKFLALGLVLGLGLLAGCDGESSNTVTPDTEQEPTEVEENVDEKTEDTVEENDAIDNGEIDLDDIEEETSTEAKAKGDGEYKTVDLSVYVSCDNATKLKREVRSLKVEDNRVGWAVLNALKEVPKEEDCFPAVSKDVTFNKLVIKDGVAIVDFDDGGVGMGSAGESIFIESVVLSLTKFPTVDKVRFTRNGEENPEMGNTVLDKDYDRSDITYSEVIE